MLDCRVIVVQLLSHIHLSATPWTAASQASLSTVSGSLLKFMSIELLMPSNHLVLGCPLLLLSSIIPSIRVFPKSWLFASGGQSTGASASASVLTVNIQDWLPLGLTALISLQSKGLSSPFQLHKEIDLFARSTDILEVSENFPCTNVCLPILWLPDEFQAVCSSLWGNPEGYAFAYHLSSSLLATYPSFYHLLTSLVMFPAFLKWTAAAAI